MTLSARAADATTELSDLAGVDLSSITGRIGDISKALGGVITRVKQARTALADAVNVEAPDAPVRQVGSFWDGPANDALVNPGTDLAPKTSPRPIAAFRPRSDIDGDLPPLKKGGGGGGGGRSQSDYERELASIVEETAALRIEAQALAELTGAQATHGDALEFARTKADLLSAALRSGVADTPELRAQIDALAAGYVKAAGAADMAADKIAEVQRTSRAGAQSIADIFAQMATGALSAQDAMKQLIIQVVQLTIKKRILAAVEAMSGMGGFGGIIGGVLGITAGGFANGGYTGHGGKNEPAGVVHRGEYIMSKAATSAIGVGNLEALHKSAQGYAGGGLVGGAGASRAAVGRSGGSGDSPMTVTINAPISVEGSSGTPEQNADLAKRVSKEVENSMRGTIVSEIQNQMRVGNMLNRRR